jgi:hypothetical protein
MVPGQPEPAGRRLWLPPKMRTAVSAGDDADGVIVLHLLDPEEESMLRESFERASWRVTSTEDFGIDLTAAIEADPWFIVTDDPSLPRSLPPEWQSSRPPVVTVVDDRQSAVEGAWSAGSEWVVKRPIDPDNPFGEVRPS